VPSAPTGTVKLKIGASVVPPVVTPIGPVTAVADRVGIGESGNPMVKCWFGLTPVDTTIGDSPAGMVVTSNVMVFLGPGSPLRPG